MKPSIKVLGIVTMMSGTLAMAQPSRDGDGFGGGPGRGPGGGLEGGPPPNPIFSALDADGDHRLSKKEIRNATQVLLSLDKNDDGQLSHDEVHSHGGLHGRPGDAGGPDTRGPDARGPGGPGGRGPGERADGGRRENRIRGPERGSSERGGPERGGPERGGPERGGPNPERFVEMALQFDADDDGKLSRDELLEFAQEMGQRGPRGAGGPGNRDSEERGPEGRGPGGDRRGGERPERPARPGTE